MPLLTPVAVLGTGHYVPPHIVTSAALDAELGHPEGHIEAMSGVVARHVTGKDENAAQMAAKAAAQALVAAGLTIHDIDCLVAASATMDQGMPCNAALVHEALGLQGSGIPAFDINASCLGFLAALDTLRFAIAAGRYQKVLVVASDVASCGLNWQRLEESAIFGDGAAAAILAPASGESGILACHLHTYSEGVHYCEIPAGGSRYHPTRIDQPFAPLTKFKMDGKGVFRLSANLFESFLAKLLDDAECTLDDMDWIIPHQASQLGLHHMAKRLAIPDHKIVNIFAHYGNQVSASLPTALDVAVRTRGIARGSKLLLLGTGAGLSLGGAVLRY